MPRTSPAVSDAHDAARRRVRSTLYTYLPDGITLTRALSDETVDALIAAATAPCAPEAAPVVDSLFEFVQRAAPMLGFEPGPHLRAICRMIEEPPPVVTRVDPERTADMIAATRALETPVAPQIIPVDPTSAGASLRKLPRLSDERYKGFTVTPLALLLDAAIGWVQTRQTIVSLSWEECTAIDEANDLLRATALRYAASRLQETGEAGSAEGARILLEQLGEEP